MKGDFARVTYDPRRHLRQVFQQQGRVLLEADWNEQGAIMLHLLSALATDLVGRCWAAGAASFLIDAVDASGKPLGSVADWQVEPGHFYVDGILCENDSVITLGSQTYGPIPEDVAGGRSGFDALDGAYAIWIDVWERHLSGVEAPWIVEPALNGVETASRNQVVWQLRPWTLATARSHVKMIQQALRVQRQSPGLADHEAQALDAEIALLEQLAATNLDTLFAALGSKPAPNQPPDHSCEELRTLLDMRSQLACPALRARLQSPESNDDPCVIAADARYRGCENQLYRVEIHAPGLPATPEATQASFKWSRENGSVIFPIVGHAVPETPVDGVAMLLVQLATLGRDQRLGLTVGDWVELIDDRYTLAQDAMPLLRVSAVDPADSSVTLAIPSGITPYLPGTDPELHPYLRRWDQRQDVDDGGVLPLVEGEWLDLEDGVQVRFEPGAVYATGDYWLVPARVATGDILWPQDAGSTPDDPKPSAIRASGLHHVAVLGGVNAEGGYHECCCRFVPPCTVRRMSMSPVRGLDARPVAAPARAQVHTSKDKAHRKRARLHPK